MNRACTSKPTPRTKPGVVVSFTDGLPLEVLDVPPVTVLRIDCLRPCSVSHATPPLIKGRAIGAGNRYFSNSGNSHAFPVVAMSVVVVVTPAVVPVPV